MPYMLGAAYCVIAFILSGGVAAADMPHRSNARLMAIQSGHGVEIGAFSVATPVGEPENHAKGVTDYSGMVYDRWNHRILLFGGGHATTFTDAIYAFDLEVLSWTALYQPTPRRFYTLDNIERGFWKAGEEGFYPRPIGRHTYDQLVIPDDRAQLYLIRSGCGPSSVAPGIGYFGGASGIYDFATGRWEMIPPIPFGGYGDAAEYDPLSKMVVGVSASGFAIWDPQTLKSQKLSLKSKMNAYSGTLIYNPRDTAMYGFPVKMEPWRLELNRAEPEKSKLSALQPDGTTPPKVESAFAWDDRNAVFGGNLQDGTAYGYDPTRNMWISQPIAGLEGVSMVFHCLIYDPISAAYVCIGANRKTKVRKMYAYKPSSPPHASSPADQGQTDR